MMTRYVGAGGAEPQLSALGSKRWDAVKARARRAARELAGELLNLYAERQARQGHAFPPDGEWQLMLERSFPYRETADQIEAIDAVKADMETPRPMDRLICGDVGYGKTEVALRAAHKAVSDGRQVMMLVPTTILAQQHLGTFRERFAEFPVEVEMVSRLRKPAEVREALRRFAAGGIEILHDTAERLRALCPGVRFAEAHGQMDEGELESTMLAFLRGDADCLVATTIIESGLDIPQANTLIVERADHLGLAQSYQIRGRVGRSAERAFAYMLYPSEEALSAEAAARLATLADHTELGSGFRIAMRDLELRGAGDLLGDEPSGHVAAVGFELYVALLDDAVAALRAGGVDGERPEAQIRLDIPVDAYVPAEYLPFEAAKIDVHRRVAAAREPGELRALRDDLRDRFGPLPEAVSSLLALGRVRIELARAGARRAEVRGERFSATPIELDAAAVARIR